MFGALVCLSSDNFDTLFWATVFNRDEKLLKSGCVDLVFAGCVFLKTFLPEKKNSFFLDLLSCHLRELPAFDQRYVMIESSSVYFEPYYHVLRALQNIPPENVPFDRHLVQGETTTSFPRYLQGKSKLDLSPVFASTVSLLFLYFFAGKQAKKKKKKKKKRKTSKRKTTMQPFQDSKSVDILSPWPRMPSTLDETQLEALQRILTNDVALIQGPPGTGKTFIGTAATKILLKNKALISPDTPILVVTLTNHGESPFSLSLSNTRTLLRSGFPFLFLLFLQPWISFWKGSWTLLWTLRNLARIIVLF